MDSLECPDAIVAVDDEIGVDVVTHGNRRRGAIVAVGYKWHAIPRVEGLPHGVATGGCTSQKPLPAANEQHTYPVIARLPDHIEDQITLHEVAAKEAIVTACKTACNRQSCELPRTFLCLSSSHKLIPARGPYQKQMPSEEHRAHNSEFSHVVAHIVLDYVSPAD